MTNVAELQRIKAVFFDLFNTLVRFWPPREEVQAQACREFGITTMQTEGIARGYAIADAYMNEVNASGNPLRTRTRPQVEAFFARYQQIMLQGAGVDVDLVRAGDIWRRVQQIPYGMKLFDDVLPSLRRLRAKGFTLGVISNMNREGRSLSKELGIDGVVHFVVTSFEAQVEKPHPAIFREALRRAGVEPKEAMHVGDQVASDVQGALGVGMHPILIDRYGTTLEQVNCLRISDMVGLEALLAGAEVTQRQPASRRKELVMPKTVQFYHYAKCMTCRNAKAFLNAKGAELQERDFFKSPFTEAELRQVLKGRPVSEAFSWKSPQVKALGLTGKQLTDDEMIHLMLKEPRLLKRPVIVMGGKAYFGFKPAEVEKMLKG
ncbi:MAG: HAD family hydrolase [Dehalococcoidia bacterium]|nr:HAD family hydrolase [Dehalococcoidia bacterium]